MTAPRRLRFTDPWLIGWITAGVALRVAYALSIQVPPISDFGWYHARALSIAAGGGYAVDGVPTSFWPVGYPAFLGALYTIFGGRVEVGIAANILLAAAVLALIAAVGRSLGLERPAVITAVALWAIWPNQIAYAALLSAEPLAQATFLAAAWAWFRGRPGWAGLGFGVATLVKPHLILVPVLWGAWATWRSRRGMDTVFERSGGLRPMLIALGVAALVLAPWTLRNASVWGRPVFVSTNGGYNLLIGAHRAATGGWSEVRGMVPTDPNEARLDREFLRAGLRTIRRDPGRWAALGPEKVRRLFFPGVEGVHWAVAAYGRVPEDRRGFLADAKRVAAGFAGIVPIALGGSLVALGLRRRTEALFPALATLLVLWFGLHAVLFGESRFLAPLTPWIALAVGHLAEEVRIGYKRHRSAA